MGDVITVPPDSDALSDEEDIADGDMVEVFVQDVPGTLEIHTNYNDQVRLITLSSIYADVSDRCKPTKKRKLCESVVPDWKRVTPKYTKR